MPGHDDPSDQGGPDKQGRSFDSGPGQVGSASGAVREDSSSRGYISLSSNASQNVTVVRAVQPLPPHEVPAVTGHEDAMLGRVLAGRFKVLEQLGRGGMGYVYRAEQVPLGRLVALKVMSPQYATSQDPEYEQRFFLEAAVAAKVTHPNTITVYDYGKDGDTFFIAMEYLQGRTLSRALQDDGPFAAERAIHVATQIARGVRAAHQHGAIHRDLKPANVMLIDHNDDADFVKVLDFGLVKLLRKQETQADLTMTGIFLGSPKYMSPEQIRNQQPDARADIYSLGVMLFQMLTGKVPFASDQPVNIMLMHLNDDVPMPSHVAPHANIPASLDTVVLRCLQKEREARFASTDELLAALKHVRLELTGSVSSSSSGLSLPPLANALRTHATPAHGAMMVHNPSLASVTPGTGPHTGSFQGAPAPQQGLDRKTLVLGIGAAMLAAAASVVLLTKFSDPVASPQPRPAPPPVAAPLPTPVAAKQFPLMVTSTPAGATVFMGDAMLGTTPLLVDLPSDTPDKVALQLKKEGFKPTSLTVERHDGRYKAKGVLKAEAAASPPPRRPARNPTRKKPLTDFKDDPY